MQAAGPADACAHWTTSSNDMRETCWLTSSFGIGTLSSCTANKIMHQSRGGGCWLARTCQAIKTPAAQMSILCETCGHHPQRSRSSGAKYPGVPTGANSDHVLPSRCFVATSKSMMVSFSVGLQ